jgi:hypothetical protein
LLDTSSPQDSHTFQVPISQIAHFVLSGGNLDNPLPASVQLQICDKSGNALLTLTAADGQPHSANVFLPAGVYTLRVLADNLTDANRLPGGWRADGRAAATEVSYLVQVQVLSDRQGPRVIDATTDPATVARAANDPSVGAAPKPAASALILSVQPAYSDVHLDSGPAKSLQAPVFTLLDSPAPRLESPASTLSAAPAVDPAPVVIAASLITMPSVRTESGTQEASTTGGTLESPAKESTPATTNDSPTVVVTQTSPAAGNSETIPGKNRAAITHNADARSPASMLQAIDSGSPASTPGTVVQPNQEQSAVVALDQRPQRTVLAGFETFVQLPLCVFLCYYLWTNPPFARKQTQPGL